MLELLRLAVKRGKMKSNKTLKNSEIQMDPKTWGKGSAFIKPNAINMNHLFMQHGKEKSYQRQLHGFYI